MQKALYVLITPARNEENYIVKTINSVLSQSIPPFKWVIVNDGSTDKTKEIIEDASKHHNWINVVHLQQKRQRDFACQVRAIEAGMRFLDLKEVSFIGLLDADVVLEKNYFEELIKRFIANPRLGIGGGVVIDLGSKNKKNPRNLNDIPGAVIFFRKDCFVSLGNIIAVPEGGYDALLCSRARMIGWETRLFPDLIVQHLRPRNLYQGNRPRRFIQFGERDRVLGYDPIFEILKCLARIGESPKIIGSVFWLIGYFFSFMKGKRIAAPEDMVRFIRHEQRKRLKYTVKKLFVIEASKK